MANTTPWAKILLESAQQASQTQQVPGNTTQRAAVDTTAEIPKATSTTAKPVEATSPASMFKLENDPNYQAAMAAGQSSFNVDKMNALAGLQNQQIAAERGMKQQNQSAEQARRSLAGNFAARGMQGGQRGAYYRAQDQANADLITAQTSTKDQLAALNQDFLSRYGGVTADWTSTAIGQNYRNQAAQQAIAAITSRYTGV